MLGLQKFRIPVRHISSTSQKPILRWISKFGEDDPQSKRDRMFALQYRSTE